MLDLLRLPLATACALLCFFAAGTASAQYLTGDRSAAPAVEADVWDWQNLPREHDRGWLLRVSAGPSWLTTRSYLDDDRSLEFAGGALDLSAAVGGIVTPDVALHVATTATVAFSPRVRLGGEALDTTTGGVQVFGVAPGATVFLPGDVYLAPSLGLSILRVRFDEAALNQPESLLGFLFDLSAGRQWWTHDRFSTGIAGRLTVHTAPSNLDAAFRGVSVGVSWVATWN